MLAVHRFAAALSLLGLMVACGGNSDASPLPTDPDTPDVKQSVVRGRVVDTQGNPLAGVQVFADNTLFYNTNTIGVTDAQGRYEIDVGQPIGTWHMSAQLKRPYRGQTMLFDLIRTTTIPSRAFRVPYATSPGGSPAPRHRASAMARTSICTPT